MNPQDEASLIKIKCVIDMAIDFSAMTRVFEKRSKQKIAEKLEYYLGLLADIDRKDNFEKIHSEFCEWLVKNVCSSKKDLENKNSQAASYGQAAKLFNVAAKVYVYYCHLPDCESNAMLLPMLHAALDNLMMKKLKEKYPKENIKAQTISDVDKFEYVALQKLVTRHIEDDYKNMILPVQYDDIMWHRLNRPS